MPENITIPDKFLGSDINGAMKRLEEKKEKENKAKELERSEDPDPMKKLEKEGWKFLANDCFKTYRYKGETGLECRVIRASYLKKDSDFYNFASEAVKEYKGQGYKEVRIEKAFSGHGEFLKNYGAIYVKR